jgi:hypothetical protein
MAHANGGEHGQLVSMSCLPLLTLPQSDPRSISPFVVILILKSLMPTLFPSAHIGEAQEMSVPHSRIEVTGKYLNSNLVMEAQIYFLQVLRARNLPRLKTKFRRKRKFYVTVTDGTTAKNTTTTRSVKEAVEWNEKLGAL